MTIGKESKLYDIIAFFLHLNMVPETGIEPVRPCGREILSLLRLPISPQQHNTIISQKATLVKSDITGVTNETI